jgi:uncharacterized protein YbjT (DUF2867 family)
MSIDDSSSNNIEARKRILVAGATGQLGLQVMRELRGQGYWTRALVRDKGRAGEMACDELFEGDVTRAETLPGACDRIDVVFSSVGASLSTKRMEDKASYADVDYAGNKNLLGAAVACGVKRFVYVSVFDEKLPEQLEYTRSHEDFVGELKRSGIDYTVLRPTGFFSAFADILEMARRGIVPLIGSGRARVNPIHEIDLARIAVDLMESGPREISVGGPQVLTRREIASLAFATLGKPAKMVAVPPRLFRLMLPLIGLYDRRLRALFDFFVAVNQVDAVAPAHGAHRLEDFFREAVAQAPDKQRMIRESVD